MRDAPSGKREGECRSQVAAGHITSPVAGVTVIEVVIAFVLFAVGALGFLNLMRFSLNLDATNSETAMATNAARQVLERMHAVPFDQVFAVYNLDPADDPDGTGTAPGAQFDLEAFSAQLDDVDGAAGEVEFPMDGTGKLREDLMLPEFGLPLDLSADGAIDAGDHATDYAVLPVIVRIRWRGRGGDRTLAFHTVLRRRGIQ